MATEKKRDDRPRVRCPECGKKLKLPAGRPGKIYRCPVCGGSIIAPLTDGTGPDGAAIGRVDQMGAQSLRRMGWTPSIAGSRRYKSIEHVANFMSKEYAELAQSCSNLLAGKAFPEHEAAARVMSLRREKGRRLVEFARRTLDGLNQDILGMEHHPMRAKKEFADRLAHTKRERRDLAIFMKVMFNISLPGVTLNAQAPPKPEPRPDDIPPPANG